MMGYNGTFGGWGMGWGFGWVFMLIFWALILLGIAALVKWLIGSSAGGDGTREKTPLDLLKERYARGEIDQEEFERKKRDLSGG
ncbi:MAG: SHOCT domain-containing protein [Gammaproteobacteria bacterium]|nr:SHOCT domain-containing protein [Gammaproteobacteria bacterium]